DGAAQPLAYDDALAAATGALERSKKGACCLASSSGRFNEWLDRTVADLYMMIAGTPTGPYPHAGVPWFSTPFGRDGLITALECLWLKPQVARGVLAFLAATQATEVVPEE